MKHGERVHRVQRVPPPSRRGASTRRPPPWRSPGGRRRADRNQPKDLRVDTFCATGPGGQGVNTTVRRPSASPICRGAWWVQCQDERSQHKNKARAIEGGCARGCSSLEIQIACAPSAPGPPQGQVGTGEPSEKNPDLHIFPQKPPDRPPRQRHHSPPARDFMEGDIDPYHRAGPGPLPGRGPEGRGAGLSSPASSLVAEARVILAAAGIAEAARDARSSPGPRSRRRNRPSARPSGDKRGDGRRRPLSRPGAPPGGARAAAAPDGARRSSGLSSVKITPDVLIPRPETEGIIEVFLRLNMQRGPCGGHRHRQRPA